MRGVQVVRGALEGELNGDIYVTVRWKLTHWYDDTYEEALEWTEYVLREEGLMGCVDYPNEWELVSIEPVEPKP